MKVLMRIHSLFTPSAEPNSHPAHGAGSSGASGGARAHGGAEQQLHSPGVSRGVTAPHGHPKDGHPHPHTSGMLSRALRPRFGGEQPHPSAGCCRAAGSASRPAEGNYRAQTRLCFCKRTRVPVPCRHQERQRPLFPRLGNTKPILSRATAQKADSG